MGFEVILHPGNLINLVSIIISMLEALLEAPKILIYLY